MFERLLAKKLPRDGWSIEALCLPVHSRDTRLAAEEVLRCTGGDQLKAIGLSPARYLVRLWQIVRLAAALHDIGKANDHFQWMLQDPQAWRQGLRHEWVTFLIIQRDAWRRWLRPAVVEDVDLDLVAWVVAGHHPAYGRPSPPERLDSSGGNRVKAEMRLLMGHADFNLCLDGLVEAFGLSEHIPRQADETISLHESVVDGALSRIGRAYSEAAILWERLPEQIQRLLAVSKACLVASDVAASTLPRAGVGVAWIRTALSSLPRPDDLDRVVHERLDGKPLRSFQREVAAQSNRVTLVRAACGSGKTLAAYRWAARQCTGRRLYVCYPTTGTATEGFRDYLFDDQERDGKVGARLFHGRAEVDRAIILGAAQDEVESDVISRLQTLDAWSTPVVCCTVDTVLGLFQNHRRALSAWPALAQSAFVFDEIHAYDEKLFGALLRFLATMRGARVLLMTASLPAARRTAIRALLAKQSETLGEVGGPPEFEQLARYHQLAVPNASSLFGLVQAEVARGGKVLWVCNLVDRAIEFAAQCAALNPIVYHSRFRYADRVARHRAVIEAFDPRRNAAGAVAVCTQVAESSLNLSATLLVTDRAPVPSLIQRLGRLNRHHAVATGGDHFSTMPFVVLDPLDDHGLLTTRPYDTSPEAYGDWPTLSRLWLERIGRHRISQAMLASAWESVEGSATVRACESKWLDGGPRTEVDTLRDASPGLTVVLERNIADLRSGVLSLVEAAIPMTMPRSPDWKDWQRFDGVPVAPHDAIDYDPQRGALWRR